MWPRTALFAHFYIQVLRQPFTLFALRISVRQSLLESSLRDQTHAGLGTSPLSQALLKESTIPMVHCRVQSSKCSRERMHRYSNFACDC